MELELVAFSSKCSRLAAPAGACARAAIRTVTHLAAVKFATSTVMIKQFDRKPVSALRAFKTTANYKYALSISAPSVGFATLAKPRDEPKANVVITSVAVGLPTQPVSEDSPDSLGSPETAWRRRFADPANIDHLLQGENFVHRLSDAQKRVVLNQHVVKTVKDPVTKAPVTKEVTKPSEVMQVMSTVDDPNILAEYGIDQHIGEVYDEACKLAIAAGLEAVYQAGLCEAVDPFDTIKDTARGRDAPSPFILKEEFRGTTGVVFASSFPALDSLIHEVTKCTEARVSNGAFDAALRLAEKRIREALPAEQAEKLLATLDIDAKKRPAEGYTFDKKLLMRVLVLANQQLAQLIHAHGPNSFLNTACAGTTAAITLAEDWIRTKRCERVIVISGDNPTTRNTLPYIGTGFLALGAASTAPDVDSACAPFDARRSGMVLGSGACALVLETAEAAAQRKAAPVCRLIGSHIANSGFHATSMDGAHIARELNAFLDRVEHMHGITRKQLIDGGLVYFAHESFTHVNGGCSKNEVDALRAAFGEESVKSITLASAKSLVAHAMAVGYEDVLAACTLQRGEIPPAAHHHVPDERLGAVRVSTGGKTDAKFVLRFAAGFGSHLVYALYGMPTSTETTVKVAQEVQRKQLQQ